MASLGPIGHGAIVVHFVRIGLYDADSSKIRAHFEPEALGAGCAGPFEPCFPLSPSFPLNSHLNSPFAAFLPPLSSLPPFLSLQLFANSCLPPFANSGLPPLSFFLLQRLDSSR